MAARDFFSVPSQPFIASTAILLLRCIAGLAFMFHGYYKIQHPFDWMGPDAGTPGLFQALAALSEFGGGLAWIIGLLTPLAAAGIASTMAVAVWTHLVERGDPFVGSPASYELASVYLCVALTLIAVGPGMFSLDKRIFGKR